MHSEFMSSDMTESTERHVTNAAPVRFFAEMADTNMLLQVEPFTPAGVAHCAFECP